MFYLSDVRNYASPNASKTREHETARPQFETTFQENASSRLLRQRFESEKVIRELSIHFVARKRAMICFGNATEEKIACQQQSVRGTFFFELMNTHPRKEHRAFSTRTGLSSTMFASKNKFFSIPKTLGKQKGDQFLHSCTTHHEPQQLLPGKLWAN